MGKHLLHFPPTHSVGFVIWAVLGPHMGSRCLGFASCHTEPLAARPLSRFASLLLNHFWTKIWPAIVNAPTVKWSWIFKNFETWKGDSESCCDGKISSVHPFKDHLRFSVPDVLDDIGWMSSFSPFKMGVVVSISQQKHRLTPAAQVLERGNGKI